MRAPAPAVLIARRDAGAGLSLVTLAPPADTARAYAAPGQYVELRAGSRSGYFALAGDVGAPFWEVLVRNEGDASEALSNAPAGTVFELNGPLGTGFPLERGKDRPLVVAVAGSALAVGRPVMRHRLSRGEARATTVYIGARSPRDVPLAAEVADWGRAGAAVVLCLSRPERDDPAVLPEASRRAGWVQRVLAEDLAGEAARRRALAGLVFAAGSLEMMDELRALSERAPTLEVITNY